MLEALLLLVVSLVMLWRVTKPALKKSAPKELCVDEVLKAADDALAFDPLRDVKNKPQAVKPLLQVLLAIREQRAEEDLKREQREREHRDRLAARERQHQRNLEKEAEERQRVAEQDVLSGRIGPGHPHYPFTEAGRREAQQSADEQEPCYRPKPTRAIGYTALEALDSLAMTAGALQLYQQQQQRIQQQALQKQAVQQAMRRLGT